MSRRYRISVAVVLVFLLELQDEATKQRVPMSVMLLKRQNSVCGLCSSNVPWGGMNTASRIGELKNLSQQAARRQREGPSEDYEQWACDVYGRMRETWERLVEEVLLSGTVLRFRRSVETSRLREVAVEDQDFDAITRGMSRCSAVFRGHDDAPAENPPVPTPDELTADVSGLDTYHQELKARKRRINSDRHARLAPPL